MSTRASTRWAFLTVLSVLLAALVAAPAVQAQLPQSARVLMHQERIEPHKQLHLANHTITVAANVLAFLKVNRQAGTPHSRAVVRRDYTWLHGFGWEKRREAIARLAPPLPAHYSAWLCIHGHEGSWTDPNAPYYGGLQMDWGFMRTYGPELLARKGTADHWTPLEQMAVAERAYASGRGFYPWPNTARMCGLI